MLSTVHSLGCTLLFVSIAVGTDYKLAKVLNPTCNWRGSKEDQPSAVGKIALFSVSIFLKPQVLGL